MRILISGAGIAGTTLAYWLARYGFRPTIVERSPGLRTGGYVVDFWGAGFDIADRMGLMPELRREGYMVEELKVVDRRGKRIAGFSTKVIARIARGRYITLSRSGLAASIFGAVKNNVETIFGDSIERIQQTGDSVCVTFESGLKREFDVVIGADGLHSRVRELVFGPEERFEKFLGYKAAAFEVDGYPQRDELVYLLYTEVGQQVGRFTMRGNRTLFLFTFADDNPEIGDAASQKVLLRKRFGNSGWELPRILDALDSTPDLYFDRVSQIRMEQEQGLWTKDRVTLVGDAAFCVSLLAGQGSALAMVAAYILAGELHRADGDYKQAFARYQDLFAPFVQGKQKAALRFAGSFAPGSKFSMHFRNWVMNLLGIPWIADLTFRGGLADKIALPDYDSTPVPADSNRVVVRR